MKHKQRKLQRKGKEYSIRWWQLSLIGVGSIIGAGFFLGTGLSIQMAGPAILIAYLIGGCTAFLVFRALADMTVHDPQTGSFREYARKAFGHSLGFMSGWMYWIAGVLIMSSEITALSTFTRFWFSQMPLWVFVIIYAAVGFGINYMGVRDFGRIESVFAVIKISTLAVFIIFGVFFVFAGSRAGMQQPVRLQEWFPNGLTGLWSAMIFVLFSYGGIAVMGIMASELKQKKDIRKAGRVMLVSLTLLYTFSVFFVIKLISWRAVSASASPFVSSLASFHVPLMNSFFNLIIISAAFSTMVGALFSITRVMVSLAEEGDAPAGLADKNRKGVHVKALSLSAAGLGTAVVLSYLLPKTVYEYITTSAGLMLIGNWMIILASHIKNSASYNRTFQKMNVLLSYTGIGLILFTVTGALVHRKERIGFFVTVGIVAILFAGYLVIRMQKGRERKKAR